MEQLDDNNSWYCPKCKAHVPASKKLDLWQLPECLVIHLKRFTQGRLSQKLDLPVDYPLAGLDLGQYVLKNQVRAYQNVKKLRSWKDGRLQPV